MEIKQLSLFIENTPGALAKVARLLRDNNISIRTLSLADTHEFGILRLLIEEYEEAKKVLFQAGYAVKLTDVLALVVPDKAGGLAEVMECIDKHELSVEYMYAFTYGYDNKAVIVCRFEDTDAAIQKLANEPIIVVKKDELFRK